MRSFLLIFTSKKREFIPSNLSRLSFFLQELFGTEMKIEELSSGLPPNIRKAVLEKFKVSKVNGLICSDSLARGIDIEGVDIVISYNVPRHIKTYIHRIGRTGERDAFGVVFSLDSIN